MSSKKADISRPETYQNLNPLFKNTIISLDSILSIVILKMF